MELDPGRNSDATPYRNAFVTIPNALSLFRGLLGPVVLALLVSTNSSALSFALMLMIIAEATDFLDGFIARKFNQSSRFGELLDPVCDTIYHLSVFMAFMSNGWMAPWMLIIIYARELAVPYICTFAHQLGHDLGVRKSGKYKSFIHGLAQITVVLAAIGAFGAQVSASGEFVQIVLLVSTAAALYSLIDYGWAVLRISKE
jgi:cardiolipin synthase (CMP-forming)